MTYMLTDKAGVRRFLPAPCWYWLILLFYVFVTLKDKERQFLFFDLGIWDPHGTEHLITYFWSFYFLFPLIMASLHFHLIPIFWIYDSGQVNLSAVWFIVCTLSKLDVSKLCISFGPFFLTWFHLCPILKVLLKDNFPQKKRTIMTFMQI